jgi:predicted DNA-binding transcriptional regulator AlpA
MPNQSLLRPDEITLITRRELAGILKIGLSSVDLIPENELPRVHLGKSIRFTLQSVNAYIQRHENPKDEKLSSNRKAFRGDNDKC